MVKILELLDAMHRNLQGMLCTIDRKREKGVGGT
jgi:hypothetical protein